MTQRTKGEFGAARPQSEGYQHSSPDARRSSALARWVEADVRGHGVSPQSLIIGFSVSSAVQLDIPIAAPHLGRARTRAANVRVPWPPDTPR